MKAAIQRAGQETARYMSARLRAEAKAAGWPSNVANALSVFYDGSTFKVLAHEHREKVGTLEYGTSSTPPAAAIRRFLNRTRDAEAFFLNRLAVHGDKYDFPVV